MPGSIKVAQWGGFDVENYGDQLFPLIAKDQLTARIPDLELTCFAPVGDLPLPPGSPPLRPLGLSEGMLPSERREFFARNFDAILVGGGDILRFDTLERGYEEANVTRPYDAFLDFLWGECESPPRIFWNAPGAPFPFDHHMRPLVRQACSDVEYMAVRDESSRRHLLETGVDGPIHVTPDSGILLKEVIEPRIGGEEARGLLEREGARLDGRRLLCFQCSPGFLRSQAKSVAQILSRLSEQHGLEIVLLPIGLCHGDREALRRLKANRGHFTFVAGAESPLEIGAIIGACDFFAGSSLHGNLTALSYGIPSLLINRPEPITKLDGLAELAGLEDFRINDWTALEDGCNRLIASPPERWEKTTSHLKSLASAHFDRLAEGISGDPGGSPEASHQPRASDESLMLDSLKTIFSLRKRLWDQRNGDHNGPDEAWTDDTEERDRLIYELTRKLRNFEEVQALLDSHNDHLADKEREVSELTQEVARLNHHLARINQRRAR